MWFVQIISQNGRFWRVSHIRIHKRYIIMIQLKGIQSEGSSPVTNFPKIVKYYLLNLRYYATGNWQIQTLMELRPTIFNSVWIFIMCHYTNLLNNLAIRPTNYTLLTLSIMTMMMMMTFAAILIISSILNVPLFHD